MPDREILKISTYEIYTKFFVFVNNKWTSE